MDIHRIDVPEHFDAATGAIRCGIKKVYRIQIRFQGSEIRWAENQSVEVTFH